MKNLKWNGGAKKNAKRRVFVRKVRGEMRKAREESNDS